MNENRVFKRFWLIMLACPIFFLIGASYSNAQRTTNKLDSFQSYMSCLMLLYSAVGKIASNAQPSTYEEDFSDIRSCLSALLFCSSEDSAAARFHETLFSIHESLLNEYVRPASVTLPHSESQETAHSKLSCDFSGALEKLSNDILIMLCRPFGGPGNREDSKECLDINYQTAASRHEHQYLMEKMDWEFEDSAPFRWDAEKSGSDPF
ncbi:hypothetical protein RRF57_000963 [Xylaria bambusicola]|uniref:Uncharacterized protein n=1 Tax=Xylaria bambusicola TaxID=326684 RepID=A0AAN7Z094_9PEZI